MSERLTDEQLQARSLVLAEMVQQEATIAALRAEVAALQAALELEHEETKRRLRGIIMSLRARVAQLEAACRSAGLCMSCLYGAPDPIGCTDCLGTGWDGGSPYDQIKVLEARVAELEEALALEHDKYVEWRGLAERYERERRAALKDAPQ